MDIVNEKQIYAAKYSRYAMILGIVSLAGMCCFPVMPIIGGLGIMFALISRGGARAFSKDARNGLILSIIGTCISAVLTVGIVGYSTYDALQRLKNDPGFVDEVVQQYEDMYDSMGQEMPEQLYEMFDELKEMSEEMNSK
ncbi:MAG: hypothetical protein K6G27_04370 [Lachnospiraceae bacterium]|nr:hypothetical protein [Lachnospiraceae bacterium]